MVVEQCMIISVQYLFQKYDYYPSFDFLSEFYFCTIPIKWTPARNTRPVGNYWFSNGTPMWSGTVITLIPTSTYEHRLHLTPLPLTMKSKDGNTPPPSVPSLAAEIYALTSDPVIVPYPSPYSSTSEPFSLPESKELRGRGWCPLWPRVSPPCHRVSPPPTEVTPL